MPTLAGVPIIEGIEVAATLLNIYIVPTSLARTRVDNITFTNHTAGFVTLTVQIVESGGSTGNAKIVIDNINMAPNSTIEPSSVLHGLNTGDTIKAIAGAANSIAVTATGTTFTE